jgi:hypothetical protein
MTQHDATTQLPICDTAVALENSENPAVVVEVVGGVDTHKDTNTAAVIDTAGRTLGLAQFPTTPAGYASLLAWLRSFGVVALVGIEGTGAYGAGLALHLHTAGVAMSRSTARSARRGAGRASPTRSTPRPPPGPRWPGAAPGLRNCVTARLKPCVCCGSRAAARSPVALMPNARSRR